MVRVEDIRSVAPELSSEASDTIQFFITMATARLDQPIWGKYWDMGVTFLAAHLITMRNRRSASGQVTDQKVGDLQVQYSDMTMGGKMDLTYRQTSYGLEYLQLRSLVVVTPIVI